MAKFNYKEVASVLADKYSDNHVTTNFIMDLFSKEPANKSQTMQILNKYLKLEGYEIVSVEKDDWLIKPIEDISLKEVNDKHEKKVKIGKEREEKLTMLMDSIIKSIKLHPELLPTFNALLEPMGYQAEININFKKIGGKA